jgi:hypothetical protein
VVSTAGARPPSPGVRPEHLDGMSSGNLRTLLHSSSPRDQLATLVQIPRGNGPHLPPRPNTSLPACIAHSSCCVILGSSPAFSYPPKKVGAVYRPPLLAMASATSNAHAWVARQASAGVRPASHARLHTTGSTTCVPAGPLTIQAVSGLVPRLPPAVKPAPVSSSPPSRTGPTSSVRPALSAVLRAANSCQQIASSSCWNACDSSI